VIIFFLVLLSTASALSESAYLSEFTEFISNYGRQYNGLTEYQQRFEVFKGNLDFINSHNSDPGRSYSVAMNQFGDRTREEYLSLLTLRPPPRVNIEAVKNEETAALARALPKSLDWRTKGAVTSVKDEGQCGGSPYFSAVAAVEACHFLTEGKLVTLSAQDLLDCSQNEGNFGCGGGWMHLALQNIIDEGGIDTEECYPYKALTGNCAFSAAVPCCGSTLNHYVNVTSGDENALQLAVFQVPVASAMDASDQGFEFYSSGVYYSSQCSTPDMGIPVIGWGNNGTMDYWILKNAWNVSWGMQGYVWLARNLNNMCGIATFASYPVTCHNCPGSSPPVSQ